MKKTKSQIKYLTTIVSVCLIAIILPIAIFVMHSDITKSGNNKANKRSTATVEFKPETFEINNQFEFAITNYNKDWKKSIEYQGGTKENFNRSLNVRIGDTSNSVDIFIVEQPITAKPVENAPAGIKIDDDYYILNSTEIKEVAKIEELEVSRVEYKTQSIGTSQFLFDKKTVRDESKNLNDLNQKAGKIANNYFTVRTTDKSIIKMKVIYNKTTGDDYNDYDKLIQSFRFKN